MGWVCSQGKIIFSIWERQRDESLSTSFLSFSPHKLNARAIKMLRFYWFRFKLDNLIFFKFRVTSSASNLVFLRHRKFFIAPNLEECQRTFHTTMCDAPAKKPLWMNVIIQMMTTVIITKVLESLVNDCCDTKHN